MNAPTWPETLTTETASLFALVSPLRILFFLVLMALAILAGRLVRQGVYIIWRLGLDTDRRLGPLGTAVQVLLLSGLAFGTTAVFIRAAPIATFLLLLAGSPLLVLLIHRPARNALAGLTILSRRNIIEGDYVLLEDGVSGVVRQIRLTSTVARSDAGGILVIPNSRLLDRILEVDRRQSGVPLTLRFPVSGRPTELTMAAVKKLGMLSPFRAGDSIATAEYVEPAREIELRIRLPQGQVQDAARQELWTKVVRLLEKTNIPST